MRNKKGRKKKMTKQAENAKTGAAAMAHSTYNRKTVIDSNKREKLHQIREREMDEEIRDALAINVDEYADWDF